MNAVLSYDAVLRSLREGGSCSGLVDPQAYHAMKPMLEAAFGVPVVSKSVLSDFATLGSYKFKWQRDNKVEKRSDALALGSLVDCLVLTPEKFDELYLCEPLVVATKKDGTPYANGQQDAEQKARWAAAAAEGLAVITPEQKARGEAIAAQAVAHLAEFGLVNGETFASQFAVWVYMREVDGVELATPVIATGMFDIMPAEGAHIWDLKTTSAEVGNYEKLMYTMEDFHYGMQAAMYVDLHNVVRPEDEREAFTFLFVGTGEPCMSRVVRMTGETLDLYREEYRGLLREYALCWKSGDWGEAEQATRWYSPSPREWRRLKGDAR